MSYLVKNTLPEKFRAASAIQTTGEELSDEFLSDMFGVKMVSLTYDEYVAMKEKSEAEAAADAQANPRPDGTRKGPMPFFCALVQQRFPDLAHVITEDATNSILLFEGWKVRPSIIKVSDGEDADSYIALFARPPKMATALEYMTSTCYDYSKEMMRGAALGKAELWHELKTILRGSECLGVEGNTWGKKLPPIFSSPMWRTDALALQAFMDRAGSLENYEDRKLIANQFYAVKALVTIGNTYSGAYESQLLKRLGPDGLNEEETAAIKSARTALVDRISTPGEIINPGRNQVNWGQGWGETFIIMGEDYIWPVYSALKSILDNNEITDPLEREIAEDFITGCELLFPKHLLEKEGLVAVLKDKIKNLLPGQPKSALPAPEETPKLITRVRQLFLPSPR